MITSIINSIIWWGGLIAYFVWYDLEYPEAGFFSCFVTYTFWIFVVVLSLVQWIIKKIF